jgi:hypothetical protein
VLEAANIKAVENPKKYQEIKDPELKVLHFIAKACAT